MSFIHYKLITNQNYDKIAFDGVSLSVAEIKKMVMEKKFRKHAPSAASSNTGNSSSRKSDVDLEVTNVDTNEVYKNDAELIPKNSRVQISRVVKNIGPAIAGGTITHTHKDSEKLADFKLKTKLSDKQVRNDLDLDDSILLGSNGSKNSDTQSAQDSPDIVSQLYDDILTENGVNSDDFLDQNDPDTFTLVNNRIDIKIPKQEQSVHKTEQDKPPGDFLCPFDDGQMKHLMDNAIIVPCCGYFICCEKCIRDKLTSDQIIECPHESCSQEITINHRLTPYPPMRNKIADYLKSQSSILRIPVEKLCTKFAKETPSQSESSKPIREKTPVLNSPVASPRNTSRPLVKLTVKLNSPKSHLEEKKETEPKQSETEAKKDRSESRSPVSSRSSSPSKVSSDSESANSKISENGSLSPVSQSQESRSNSPTPPPSPKETEKPEQSVAESEPDVKKNDEAIQPIQPVYNHQYIPPQQFYPYNMPTGQIYPQMDPFFNPRYTRPNFAMQPQAMFNSNMMRYPPPPPGSLNGQNFYQMYPNGHQGFMPEQFFPNRAHPSFNNGYQFQSFQRNNKIIRRRSRSRSRSRRSPDRSRRKRSYSRSRSRSPRRHRRNSRHRSRSPSRRDKRATYRRRSSSRKRDRSRSRSRSRERQKKQIDDKPHRNERAEEPKTKPVNKENEMDQREKTIHKLNNLMHRKSNAETKNFANGASVALAGGQIKESQIKEEKDEKKNQIVILLKTNSKQNEIGQEKSKKTSEDGTEIGSPVKKTTFKRKVHLKKELATTSTVKKIMLNEKKCSESEDRADDFLDISIDEKINL